MFNPLFLPLALLLNYCAPVSDTAALTAAGTQGPSATVVSSPALGRLAYDFSPSAATYPMPAKLAELSGIVLSGAGYRLDPTTYKVQTPAAYVLDVDAIVAAVPRPAGAAAPETGKKGKKGKHAGEMKGFAPSAVAVHPGPGHVFVLSARQNALVELDSNGELLAAAPLPGNLFPQAEGLAFTPEGDLYIATEAGKKSGQAMVHLFRQQR